MFSCGLYFWFVDTFWMEDFFLSLWGGGEYACLYVLFHVCPFLPSPGPWNSWPDLGCIKIKEFSPSEVLIDVNTEPRDSPGP